MGRRTTTHTTTGLQNPAYQFNPRYQEFSYELAAGGLVDINTDSDFVSCLAADDEFKISFDNGTESNFKRGLKYIPGQTIRRITIRNTSAETNKITLGLGVGDIVDARLSVPLDMLNAMATPDTGVTTAYTINGAPIGAEIAGLNPSRREAIIQNVGANYIVLSFVSANQTIGIKLDAGAAIALEHSGRIFANGGNVAGGVATTLWVTERGFGFNFVPPGI